MQEKILRNVINRIFLINKGVKLLDATLDEIYQRYDPRTIVAKPVNGKFEATGLIGVREVRKLEHSAGYELELEDDADPQRIMQQVLSNQAMRSVELRRLTLDEVFVQLVRQDEGSVAAEQAREELSHV